jgi:C-methyltransferase
MDVLQIRFFSKKYALTNSARQFLVPNVNNPGRDLTPLVLLYWNKLLLPHITNMESAIVKGGTQEEVNASTPDNPLWSFYAEVTPLLAFSRGKSFANYSKQFSNNNKNEKKKVRILDVAAGSGGYGYAFSEIYENSEVTFIDYANVIEQTKKNEKVFNLTKNSKFSYIEGDIFTADLLGPYDIIIASNIYQHFSIETSIKLTNRLANVLSQDGVILILDFVRLSEDGSPGFFENPMVSELSFLMLLFSNEGQAFSEGDWKNIMIQSKCKLIQLKHNFPFPFSYIVGKLS